MRELSNNEISFVSGAGIAGTVGGVVGGLIGSGADVLFSFIAGGKQPATSFKGPATSIGQGLGGMLDSILNPSGFSTALGQLTSGVSSLVQAITTNISGILTPPASKPVA